MREKELRRSLAVLPIGTVMKLTDLSARQIRYYEEHQLVVPQRTEGNHRMYSLNDVDRLLEIKDLLHDGFNIAGIKRVYAEQERKRQQQQAKLQQSLSDDEMRRILRQEFMNIGGMNGDAEQPLHHSLRP
ncbi:MerR family transcriptional regulator [Ligilactobacillus hohenheimensis]|uniref:MerR family transcriptional regulator n=1 Tax=Ligilactobacillus hohenheimensis TaxID=2991832 RepID=UPI0024BADB3E|nr:MerR family transcriptional regulator [Ligilactobacillus hohenheimensis]